MYSILDIDLDYFNLMPDASQRLHEMLTWASCPVSIIVDHHNHAFTQWRKKYCKHITPSHILHVDEHHDMMDQRQQTNIANFMYHAMCLWQDCRVHWMVQEAIDSPSMWLEEETWNLLKHRFSYGPHIPDRWPKPHIVSVCTSPDFVSLNLTTELLDVLSDFMPCTKAEECRIGIGTPLTGCPFSILWVGPSKMPNWCGFRSKTRMFFGLKTMFLGLGRAF